MSKIQSLGIQGLQQSEQRLEPKSLYWLNVELLQEALRLVLSLSLTAATKPLLVMEKLPKATIDEVKRSLKGLCPDYQLVLTDDPMTGLVDIAQSLPYWTLRNRTMVVLLPSEATDSIDARDFESLLKSMSHEAESRDITLVFIHYGHQSERLQQRLFQHQMCLHGLATLNASVYHLLFWRTRQLAVTNIKATLEHVETGFSVSSEAVGELIARDQSRIIAVEGAWKKEALDQDVEILASNRAVYEMGLTCGAATLVFLIDDMVQVKEVASWVHHLRIARGRFLKIVIKENVLMRATVEALLLGCGTNLIFQPSASFGYMQVMIKNLIGQVYARSVHPDFERVYDELMHINQRGYIERDAFIEQVETVVTQQNDALTSRGALVVLTPREGLDAVETLMSLKMVRGGDIATVVADRVVLFLYGCQSSYLKDVLKRIFVLAPQSLFETYLELYDNQQIVDLLDAMKHYRLTEEMTGKEKAMFSYARERSAIVHEKMESGGFDDYIQVNPISPILVKEQKHV